MAYLGTISDSVLISSMGPSVQHRAERTAYLLTYLLARIYLELKLLLGVPIVHGWADLQW